MLFLGLTSFLFLLRLAAPRSRLARLQIYYVVLFALFLFSGFRYQVGCDWSGYYFQYAQADSFDTNTIISLQEPIWWAILALIKERGLPYPVINIVSSAVFFAGVHVLARRQPDPLGFLVLLFPILIVNMPMSGIRQGAAIGLICIAFSAFIDRRPFKYTIWTIIAGGVHTSALIFLLPLSLITGRFTRGRLMLAAIMMFPAAYFLASSGAAEIARGRYFNTNIDAAGAFFRVGILSLSSLYFFVFLRRKWLSAFPRDYNIVSISAIGMALVLLITSASTVIGDRLAYYLIPIQTMIFARLPFLPFRENHAIHSALPYLGLWVTFLVWSIYSALFNQCYNPYQTWIFGFPGDDPIGLKAPIW